MEQTVGYHNRINIEKTIEENLFFVVEIKNNPENKKIVTQPIHRHPYYEIIFVTEGELHIEIDFKEHTIKKGSVCLFSPLQVHHPKQVNEAYGCFLLRFYPNLFDNAEFFKGINIFDYDTVDLPESLFDRCKMLLDELSIEFKGDLAFKDFALGNLLKFFLITLQRAVPETSAEKTYDNYFSKLNYLIVEDQFKITKPSEYAKKLGLSPRSLNDVVKKHTGISAGEYIKSKTIYEAKRLLSFTSLTVKEIAYQLGFDDVAYFSRFFKKNTDISALQYREEYLDSSKSEKKAD